MGTILPATVFLLLDGVFDNFFFDESIPFPTGIAFSHHFGGSDTAIRASINCFYFCQGKKFCQR